MPSLHEFIFPNPPGSDTPCLQQAFNLRGTDIQDKWVNCSAYNTQLQNQDHLTSITLTLEASSKTPLARSLNHVR